VTKPADTGAEPRVAVLLTPLARAGDGPEEVQAAALVSQMVRARLSRMAGLRIVDSSPIGGLRLRARRAVRATASRCSSACGGMRSSGDHCCPFVAKNTSGRDIFAQSLAIPANSYGFIPDRTASSA
jgi:hypothetical protein